MPMHAGRAPAQLQAPGPPVADTDVCRGNEDYIQGVTLQTYNPPTPGIIAALRGLNVSPQLTALMRSILLAIAEALPLLGLIYLQTPPVFLAVYAGVLIIALRNIEAALLDYGKSNAGSA